MRGWHNRIEGGPLHPR